MNEKYIVVGDVHGCLAQLDEILAAAKSYPDHRFVFLGNYIDRGTNSDNVINRIKQLDGVFLRGNHEDMILERKANMDRESFKELLKLPQLSFDSVEWIASETRYRFETDACIFVHAGLNKNSELGERTDKKVIHGHTIVDEPEIIGNRININTGCGSNGYLTALILPEGKFVRSSNSSGSKTNWKKIKEELQKELSDCEEVGTLEEVADE